MTINLNPHLQRLIVVSVTSLVIGLAVAGLDWYLAALIQKQASELTLAKSAAYRLELKQKALVKERERVKELEPRIAEVERAFVNATEPLLFIESLENLARRDGVMIKLGLPQKKNYTLTMRLEAEGFSRDVLAFAAAVESMPEQVVFADVTFEQLTEKLSALPAVAKGQTPRAGGRVVRLAAAIEFLAK